MKRHIEAGRCNLYVPYTTMWLCISHSYRWNWRNSYFFVPSYFAYFHIILFNISRFLPHDVDVHKTWRKRKEGKKNIFIKTHNLRRIKKHFGISKKRSVREKERWKDVNLFLFEKFLSNSFWMTEPSAILPQKKSTKICFI